MSTIALCFILLITLSVTELACSTPCNFPPSVWCSSPKIAEICQVTSQCRENVWASDPRGKPAKPVDITVYMESLCPDCKYFFLFQLWPTWKRVSSIMDLKLVPYGNAMEENSTSGWKFTCQHGPDECYGNLLETCAIYTVKNISVYLPFINCLEKSSYVPYLTYRKCAKTYGIDPDELEACAEGPYGNKLEHEMAELTNSLDPPHTFVPWVTLNGIHTEEIQKQAQEDLTKLICDSYKGPKPEVCLESKLKGCKK